MDVSFVGDGTIDDSRAGIFLWGTSAIAQRPEYHDDEPHPDGSSRVTWTLWGDSLAFAPISVTERKVKLGRAH